MGARHWSESEEQVLRCHYASGKQPEILADLPGRSWDSAKLHAQKIGLERTLPREDLQNRFWRQVSVEMGGCWIWTGAKKAKGYGYFKCGSRIDGTEKSVAAYRFSYETSIGPIPANLDLDHLCRNPSCVHPLHLEPVTRTENLRRGCRVYRYATHCSRGHEFTISNTGHTHSTGVRFCKICKNVRQRRRYHAKKKSVVPIEITP